MIVGQTEKQESLGQVVRTFDLDSRARTHLANERTFLAWLRTGLSLVALGLAAAQFLGQLLLGASGLHTLLAYSLVLAGILLTIIGCQRFLSVQRGLTTGQFRDGRIAVVIATVLGLLVGFGALLVVRYMK